MRAVFVDSNGRIPILQHTSTKGTKQVRNRKISNQNNENRNNFPAILRFPPFCSIN